ncbi:hypothetical protein SLS56_002720 [Neofusicoccum ribis]|uniref:Retrovirus-related Pol polyprotein from transposon TNT 1-94-like beta-barrel domain-containing protein n=1 Tax=Neofusicoccum ribis TaxID=45134 RepID=A0ABR3T2Q3_9PEZI
MRSFKAQSSVYPWEVLRIKDTSGAINRDAWVHIPCGQGRFSICHDRKNFITYDQFTEPIPIQNDLGASGLCAIGIGEVRLRVRKSNNEVEECTLEAVLHVPKAAANLICPRSLSNVCDGFTFPTSGPQEYAMLNDEYGHEKICFRKSIGRHLEAHWVLNQDGQDGVFWRRKNIPARSYPLLRLDCWIDKDPFDFLNPLVGKKNKAESHPNGSISHNTEPGSSSTAAATPISADPQHPSSKRKGTKKPKSKKRKSKKRSPEAGPPVEITGPSLHDFQLEVKGGSEWSKYRFIKVNWWSRPRFQAHYGLSMSPKDLEGGNEILDEYKTFGYFS